MRSISRAFLFPGSMARALSMALRALAWLFWRKWFSAALVRASTSERRPSGLPVRGDVPGSDGGTGAGAAGCAGGEGAASTGGGGGGGGCPGGGGARGGAARASRALRGRGGRRAALAPGQDVRGPVPDLARDGVRRLGGQ